MDEDYTVPLLYFLVGAIIVYLGGLYGDFEKNILLIIPGIFLKFYAAFLMYCSLKNCKGVKNAKEEKN